MEQIKILVGDRLVSATDEMVGVIESGGRLLALRRSGEVLAVPADVVSTVDSAVSRAVEAFQHLQIVPPSAINAFFSRFADLIGDENAFGPVLAANRDDVLKAKALGRATGRLELTAKMRADMIGGLRMWADLPLDRLERTDVVDHGDWSVESWRSPLGVVAFVFEGRPNVFADATGVLKTGNAVVFRIGSDALGTARAIRDHLLVPALRDAGLPEGSVQLVDSPERSAGWALFDDPRLALAVARGSGPAVGQLGEVARQAGVPVSLHGTGGAWLIVGRKFDSDRLGAIIEHSLDRKVCNTLNTLVLTDESFEDSLRVVRLSLGAVARRHGGKVTVHAGDSSIERGLAADEHLDVIADAPDPGIEWEWDSLPELTVIRARNVKAGVESFNRHSPRFVLSVCTSDASEEDAAWFESDAPFFGDGFTRWVDGQFALGRPELGLANWQFGRLLGRGGVLLGDGVHTVRLRVRQRSADLHR